MCDSKCGGGCRSDDVPYAEIPIGSVPVAVEFSDYNHRIRITFSKDGQEGFVDIPLLRIGRWCGYQRKATD